MKNELIYLEYEIRVTTTIAYFLKKAKPLFVLGTKRRR